VDVVMMLRIQRERMGQADLPDADRYYAQYGLNGGAVGGMRSRMRIVMHPQPMNRGIEIASDVADGPQSVIRDQVRNGVAVRMAVLADCELGRGARDTVEERLRWSVAADGRGTWAMSKHNRGNDFS